MALILFGATKTLATAGESNEAGDSTSESMLTVEEMFRLHENFAFQRCIPCSMTGVEEDDANLNATAVGQVAMYRLYNPYSGEHFYTSDKTERDGLIKIGWKNENIGWVAPTTSSTPVYRLYNSYCEGGDHHYTASKKEYDDLKKAGWTQEGICWYSVDFDSVYKATIYRQYNPNQYSCNHNYTIDKSEKEMLIKAGWNDEGIAYYGLDFSKMSEIDFSQFTVDTSAKTYNGFQFKPSVTSKKYSINTDYVVIYGANKNAGIGTITIQGTGAYYGKKTYTFKINKATLNVSWKNVALTYNAKAQAPKATVTGVLGTDKVTTSVSGAKTNAGENYTATATINNSNYQLSGNTTKFSIAKLDISSAAVRLGDSLTYTGAVQTQAVKSVQAGSLTLATSDYTVSNNKGTNAGDYTLKVSGKGNFTGNATKAFTIAKGKPVSVAPTGLTGYVGDTLSTVDIASETVTGNTPGTFTWAEGTQTMSEAGDKEFTATFTPSVTKNYETVQTIVVKVKVVKPILVTFNATAPGSESITMDGVAQTEVTKSLSYDDLAATNPTHTLVAGDFPTIAITSTNSDGYQFAGWSTTQNDTVKYGIAQDQLVSNNTQVSSDVTYYAIWLKASGYWMGTKGADVEYSNEAYFVTHDTNYIPASTIQADMKVLHDSTNANYTTVKEKWDKYYSDDNVRLYATYEGGENEESYSGYAMSSGAYIRGTTSQLNKYVEFRILEVSGAEGHKLSDGTTSDGSAVTFMATHVLPTAYQINTGNTNNGGWGACQLYKDMNEVSGTKGKIYSKFSDDFVKQVKAVTKEYNTGNGAAQSANPSTVDCQFWIPSYTELVSAIASDYPSFMPKLEGTQYAWCAKNVINATLYGNSCLAYTTRGGATPGSCYNEKCDWWERSPIAGMEAYFSMVWYDGDPGDSPISYLSYLCFGVAPAFAF